MPGELFSCKYTWEIFLSHFVLRIIIIVAIKTLQRLSMLRLKWLIEPLSVREQQKLDSIAIHTGLNPCTAFKLSLIVPPCEAMGILDMNI